MNMVTNSYVENIAASLVREYLSRKGCKSTLERMDTELPRTEESIGNRSQLAKDAHIEKIMRKNKDAPKPFRAMIEVIVKFLVDRASGSKDGEGIPEQRSSTDMATSERKSSRSSSARRKERSDHGRRKEGAVTPTGVGSPSELSGLPQQDVGTGSLQREPTTVVTMKDRPSVRGSQELEPTTDLQPALARDYSIPDDRGRSSLSSPPSSSKANSSSSTRTKRLGSASRSRGLAGPISSSLDASDRRRSQKSSNPPASSSSPNISVSLGADLKTSDLDLSPSNKTTSSTSRNKLKSFGFDMSLESTAENPLQSAESPRTASQKSSVSLDETSNGQTAAPQSSLTAKDGRLSRHRRSLDEPPEDGISSNRPGSRNANQLDSKNASSSATSAQKTIKKDVMTLGDLEMGDVDEQEVDLGSIQLGSYTPSSKKPIDSRAITLQLAMQLKNLLFGNSNSSFSDEWRLQGFGFNEMSELSYGIVQHKGGPCGVLASLQACMLQRLLFAEGSTPTTAANLKQLGAKKRTDCLIQAICDVVWRAGQKRSAAVALPTPRAHFPGGGCYKSDGLTETLNLNLFKSRDELHEFVRANARAFTDSRGSGCILFLYSALFSRTIDSVIEDVDDPGSKLLGAHGYCTQEMVNLILTGRAVSNVFNDVVELGSGKDVTRLRGLSGRSDIGLLSLFEHYKSCQVGTYFKTPRFPIWVVCSESHFSVLFSIKKELTSDWRYERRFDLYYYDGLAKQQEEIRLTIDTTQTCPDDDDDDDLVPPLEHCIRTKWPEASVHWNGSEPIL